MWRKRTIKNLLLVTTVLALALSLLSCGTVSTRVLEERIKNDFQRKISASAEYREFEMKVQSVTLTQANMGSRGWLDMLIELIVERDSRTFSYAGNAVARFDHDNYTIPITAQARPSGEYTWEWGESAFDFLNGIVYIPMQLVEGDKFNMGCTSEQGAACYNKERPAHLVTISGFLIGRYPVTQKQWVRIMGSNPSGFKGDELPVENVSWHDAQNFIRRLNSTSGKTYRLPTEAEWEYAARGGIKSKGQKYAGGDDIDNTAWYMMNSGDKTHIVGTKRPNELGIFDMSGNVWEWVGDWYGEYDSSPKTDPTGPPSGSTRVNRGGSWEDDARFCRVSNRGDNTPESRFNSLGFRVARSLR
jgi:hypothetical protein